MSWTCLESAQLTSRFTPQYDYDWATECLILKKEDIIKNMSMQASYKAQIEIKGKIKFVQFNRGDLIYTLPDPRDLEKNEDGNTSTTRTELSTEDMWVAQIADCCVLKATSSGGTSNLGILRVRWLYNQKQASELNQGRAVLHGQYVNQVEKMQFEKHEVREKLPPPVSTEDEKLTFFGNMAPPCAAFRGSTQSRLFSCRNSSQAAGLLTFSGDQ